MWAGQKVHPESALPSPNIDERELLDPNTQVVTLSGLVRMKLVANRDQDRVHFRDLIDVGLVTREMAHSLPVELGSRLDALLGEFGR